MSESVVPRTLRPRPRAWQRVWGLHLSTLEDVSEKYPFGHCLHLTSSASPPGLLTPEPGGHREWGLRPTSLAKVPGAQAPGAQAHLRSVEAVHASFSAKGGSHGGRQRRQRSIPFSLRVKLPWGHRLHSRTLAWVQCRDT